MCARRSIASRARVFFRSLALAAALCLWTGAARAQAVDPLYAALDGYALYQNDVSALLDAEIDSAAALDEALERAARHDPAAVARGWIAYGALTAAQSPAFAAGVQSRARAAGRAPVLRQLRRDLGYARRRPPGSARAVELILAAVAADSGRLRAAADRYADLGAAIDAAPWTPTDRGARVMRLRQVGGGADLSPAMEGRLRVGALAGDPTADDDAFGGRRFWDALAGRTAPAQMLAPRENQARASTTDRMLTLAALIIVGAAGSESARVAAVLDDQRTRECLAMEQLQFRQCASVAHDANEDAFCLARHGLSGPSACFGALLQ